MLTVARSPELAANSPRQPVRGQGCFKRANHLVQIHRSAASVELVVTGSHRLSASQTNVRCPRSDVSFHRNSSFLQEPISEPVNACGKTEVLAVHQGRGENKRSRQFVKIVG